MAPPNDNGRRRDRDAALSWDLPPGLEVASAALAGSRDAFAHVAISHLRSIVDQLLAAEGVVDAAAWAPQLVRLAQEAVACLSPGACTATGQIDPLFYVKVKRLAAAGSAPDDSSVVAGVACRKNVAHKRMRMSIPQPRVLLLGGSLEFSRSLSNGSGAAASSKLSSFETLMEQEQEYLRGCVERLASLRPDLLLVERSVARYAQELLLEKNISLVLNVRQELLQRIARCVGAEIVPSLDQLSAQSIGTCREFDVETIQPPAAAPLPAPTSSGSGSSLLHSAPAPAAINGVGPGPGASSAAEAPGVPSLSAGSNSMEPPAGQAPPVLQQKSSGVLQASAARSLMCFHGCPRPLGCTILLRGADLAELTKLKRVAAFAAYTAYWNRLESSFLADQLLAAATSVVPGSLSGPKEAPSEMLAGIAEAVASSSYLTVAEQRGRQAITSASPHVSVFQERGAPLNELLLPEAEEEDAGGLGQAEQEGAAAAHTLLPGAQPSTDSDPWALPATFTATRFTVSGAASARTASGSLSEEAAAAGPGMQQQMAGTEAHSEQDENPATPTGQQQQQQQQRWQPMSPQDPLSLAAKQVALLEAGDLDSEDGSPHASEAPPAGNALAAAAVEQGPHQQQGQQQPPQQGQQQQQPKGGGEEEEPGVSRLQYHPGTAIYDLQRLWLSISCKNPAKGVLCEPPHMHCMDFYANADLTLAAFLTAAAPSNRKCPHPQCGDGAFLHLRSFMRGDGLVTLSSVRLPPGRELPGAEQGQVWLWLRPLHRGPEAATAAQRVPFSPESSCLSFAHLLALLLDARHLAVGGMSLQRDFVRYLGVGHTVLCLHYSHVAPFDVLLPPRDLELHLGPESSWLQDEIKGLTEEGDEAFTAIEFALVEQLQQLGTEDAEFAQMWLDTLAETRRLFLDLVQQTVVMLDAPALHQAERAAGSEHWSPSAGSDAGSSANHAQEESADVGASVQVVWALNRVRRLLATVVLQWATALHEGTPAARAAPPSAAVDRLAVDAQARHRHSRHASAEALEQPPSPVRSATDEAAAAEGNQLSQQQQQEAEGMLLHKRSRSTSLGQQFVEAVSQEKRSAPVPISDASYAAPSLFESSCSISSPAAGSAGAKAVDTRDIIPTGLVARYVAMYDTTSTHGQPGGAAVSPSSGGSAAGTQPARQGSRLQRTHDWVGLASETEAGEGSYGTVATAGQAEEEEGSLTGSEDEEAASRGGRPTLQRPSFRIDLNHVDAELVSAVTPSRSNSATEEPVQAEGSASKLEQLTARLSRMSLSQSFSELQQSRALRRSSLGSPQQLGELPALPAVQEQPAGAAAAAAGAGAAPEAAVAAPAQTSEGEEAPRGSPGHLISAARSSGSHFEEWKAVLPQPPGAAEAHAVAAAHATAAKTMERAASGSARADSQPLSTPSASPAGVSTPAGGTPAGDAGHMPPLRAALRALAGSASGADSSRGPSTPKSGSTPPGEQQQVQPAPSRLKQLLARLRNELGPSAEHRQQQRRLASGLVELSGRSLLPPGADGMAVTVFDEEPTSVVAYFLSTKEYQQYLRDAVATVLYGEAATPAPSSTAGAEGGGTTASMDMGAGAVPLSWQASPTVSYHSAAAAAAAAALDTAAADAAVAGTSGDGASQQGSAAAAGAQQAPGSSAAAACGAGLGGAGAPSWRVLLSEQQQDCQLLVEDPSPGMPWGRARFQATAYYAPQFADLRARVVAGGEQAFLASISRCRKWATRGGKSAAYFARSRDERYVIKQLSRSERQSFLEFAPHYFRHVAAALARGGDTCMAKILGVFQVSVQYTGGKGAPSAPPFGGKDGTMDLLITENVFYNRQVHRIYDLKGSERDRYAADDPTMAGAVLLDENLRELNLSSPTAVGPAAYARLQRALWSDTAFLAGLGVMDYSLLVGVDRRAQELVVGVIDFIRQYTWDKQVETWVKKSGILGGAGKDPTVISPKQYCRRFRAAMASYFTVVPSLTAPEPALDPDAA